MAADDTRPTVPSLWRRKTRPLEVMHWDGSASGATAVIDWVLANDGTARYHDDPARLRIDLPRGTVDALPGDRVIKAEDGTFRPLDEPGFFTLLEPVGVLVSGDSGRDLPTAHANAQDRPGLIHRPGPKRMVARQVAPSDCLACGQRWPCKGSWQARAERAEARLAAVTDACRSIPSPIAERILAIIGTGEEAGRGH